MHNLVLISLTIFLGVTIVKWIAKRGSAIKSIAIFHPFCDAGGGGERVLWTAIGAIQNAYPGIKIFIYTAKNDLPAESIMQAAKRKFHLEFKSENVTFVPLLSTKLLKASTFPRLTLLMQSIGSLIVGLEAVYRHQSPLVIDTIGSAFSYPPFFISGSRIHAYVHYPFISNDMIERVRSGTLMYNNDKVIGGSRLLTLAKIRYYQFVLIGYKLCGLLVDKAMVNSRWTEAHMKSTWNYAKVALVYPPCDVDQFSNLAATLRKKQIVSLAQFRPEKNHALQLLSFAEFLKRGKNRDFKLILCGGVRDAEDRERVEQLKGLAAELNITDSVGFEIDVKFGQIKELLRDSLIGLHTMTDEHFGISVVEFMAAGMITIANDSGGPKTDIVEHGRDGFRASTIEEYADLFEHVLSMTEDDLQKMRQRAREKSVDLFSAEKFCKNFVDSLGITN